MVFRYNKSYEMKFVEADAGEEFTIPQAAEDVEVDYRETDSGQKYVRVSYLVRADGGGSVK